MSANDILRFIYLGLFFANDQLIIGTDNLTSEFLFPAQNFGFQFVFILFLGIAQTHTDKSNKKTILQFNVFPQGQKMVAIHCQNDTGHNTYKYCLAKTPKFYMFFLHGEQTLFSGL